MKGIISLLILFVLLCWAPFAPATPSASPTLSATLNGGKADDANGTKSADVTVATAAETKLQTFITLTNGAAPWWGVMKEAANNCKEKLGHAKMGCAEQLSPIIQELVPMLQTGLSIIGAAVGAADQCSKTNDFIDLAQKGLTAYNAACGTTKALCVSSCKGAMATIGAACAKITDATKEQCNLNAKMGTEVTKEAVGVCVGYDKNIMAGVTGIGQMVMAAQRASQCANQVVDCTKNPMNPSCQKPLNCNLVENSTNPKCICEKNPRAAGCGAADFSGQSKAMNNRTNPGSDQTGGPGTSLGAYDQPDSTAGPSSSGEGGGLMGGGGGGSRGAGPRGNAGTDSAKGKEKSGLNANILGGESGGGGGRGFGRSASENLEKYRAFLPKKEGRDLAGKLTDVKQVTGSNGLSNWEKVRTRYKENKPSLINN